MVKPLLRYTALFLLFISLIFTEVRAQNYEVIKFDELDKMIHEESDQMKVFNFWATWCRPCIKELPLFEKLNEKYDDVEVLLISFDFPDQAKDKLSSFIEKRGLRSKVYWLDETDFNAFIDKIDPSWSGALPATLVVSGQTTTKYFYEKSFEQGELESTILNIKQKQL